MTQPGHNWEYGTAHTASRGEMVTVDPATGVLHERATVRNEEGVEKVFDAWTTCFTARELEVLAERSGLDVDGVHGVAPGRYGTAPPTIEDPELLLLARRRS